MLLNATESPWSVEQCSPLWKGTVAALVSQQREKRSADFLSVHSSPKVVTCKDSLYPLDTAGQCLIPLLLLGQNGDVVANDAVNQAVTHSLQGQR